MPIRNAPSSDRPVAFLRERAKAMRRHMLRMSRAVGQGYLAQGLGIADALAAIYFHELRYDPANLQLAGARPLPALDRPLLDCALGGVRRGRHDPARRARHLRTRREPARNVDHGVDAGRRDDRRLARPRARPGGRHGARHAAEQVRRARVRRILRRRIAGRRDLRGPDGGRKLRPRQPGRADRLQRHPGRRQDRDRHRAGRRQVPRVRLGHGRDRRQCHGRRSSPRCTARADATAGRRRSCCAPCPAAACATLERREKAHFVRVEPHEWAVFERELEASDV